MLRDRLTRWRRNFVALFAERHIYIRSPQGVKGILLTRAHQAVMALGVSAVSLWAAAATFGLVIASVDAKAIERQSLRDKTHYAGLMAARESQLISAAEDLAHQRSEQLRLMFRLAGVDPGRFTHDAPGGKGGPLIDTKDPMALASALAINGEFAGRLQRAAKDVAEASALTKASAGLPLARPTNTTEESSGFGARSDPFTGRSAFHPGLDFPAPRMTAVFATGAGVVSFTGIRSGYGNTVEVAHGGGIVSRFGHLAAISVRVGEHVDAHTKIGGIGSTGRSTGPHLHYEIWRDGRAENPQRFLKAGAYVQQNG